MKWGQVVSAMVVADTKLDCLVDPINWENVRPIYKKMQDDFHWITRPFGIELSGRENLHLSHLIATIDVIDRVLDPLSSRSAREDLAAALLCYLNGGSETIESEYATPEIRWRLQNLRRVIIAKGVQAEFCKAVAGVFEHTEAKRWVTTPSELLYHLRKEWRLAGRMTVLVMGDVATPQFEKFFYLCCAMMPSVDMIRDAGRDFENGEVAVKPSLGLYYSLAAGFLLPMPKLLWRFPRPTCLIRYALGFLVDVFVKQLD